MNPAGCTVSTGWNRFACLAILTPLLGVIVGWDLSSPDPTSIDYPDGSPPSAEEVDLGKTLFFDPRLSSNQTISCASCHNPDLGFSDGLATSLGSHGNHLARNAPHLYNLAWSKALFWDGRATTLEEQALGPITAVGEMGMKIEDLIVRLDTVPYYHAAFAKVYPDGNLIAGNIARAIASFERTIISVNSPFDRYRKGDHAAMSPEAVRGMDLFKGKANCIACHSGPNFTDDSFHNLGMHGTDPGRAKIMPGTPFGAFKTPGLRNVLLTAPYMHDGSIPSLAEVVNFYDRGGDAPGSDPLIKPLKLDDGERRDLVAFLGALTDPVRIERPKIP
jgi:cytochrome c peroxidase